MKYLINVIDSNFNSILFSYNQSVDYKNFYDVFDFVKSNQNVLNKSLIKKINILDISSNKNLCEYTVEKYISNKIYSNVEGFGSLPHSEDTEFKVNNGGAFCYKKGTEILHNEFGPVFYHSYKLNSNFYSRKEYYINGHRHREDGGCNFI